MNSRILTIGLFLLIIGTGLYMIAITQMPQYETLIGSISRAMSSDARQKYELLKLFQVIGPAAGVTGFILSIAGIVSPSDNK